MVEHDLTWDKAIKSLTVIDQSISLRSLVEPLHPARTDEPKNIGSINIVKHKEKVKNGFYCHICKRTNHTHKNCRLKHKKQSNPTIICHRCGKLGHIAANCRTKVIPDFKNPKRKYDDNDTRNTQNVKRQKQDLDESYMKYVDIRMLTQNYIRKINTYNTEYACLDSGASCHVMSTKCSYLNDLRINPSYGNKLRSIVENATLDVIGHITLGVLKDVAIVSDNVITDNIISVAKLDEADYQVTFKNCIAAIHNEINLLICQSFSDESTLTKFHCNHSSWIHFLI